MAFDNSNNEEQLSQQANGTSLAPASSVISSGPPGQGAGPTHSGSFTNLQSYLDANQGGNFAGQLSGDIQNQINQANTAQNAANSQFQSDVNAGTVNYNPTLINSAFSNPTSFVQDPNNISQFQQELNAQYTGPNNTSQESNLFNNASQSTANAQQGANALQSEGGRFALLNQFFNQPNYTQGQQNLDQFLLESDPNAQSTFNQTAQNANQSTQNWNNSVNQDNALAQNAANQTAQTAQQVYQGLYGTGGNPANLTGGALGNLYNNVQQNTQNALNSYGQQNQDVSNALNNLDLTKLSPQEAQELGLSGFSGPLFNVNPSQFYSASPQANFNVNTVATPDQQAQMAALAQLGGVQNTWLPNASQAGTAPQDFTFNLPGFQQAVNAQQNQYQAAQNALNSNPAYNYLQPVPGVVNAYTHNPQGPIDLQNALNQLAQQYGANQYFKQ